MRLQRHEKMPSVSYRGVHSASHKSCSTPRYFSVVWIESCQGSNCILLMASPNGDVFLIVEQETDILRPSSICLSGKKLGDLTGTLPNEPVHFKLDAKGEKVEFRAGRFKSKLSGTQSEQFPEVPRVAGESLKIAAAVFYEGLKRTVFAVAEANQRFTINGILLLVEDSSLKMVSTDGHRLCFFRMATGLGNSENLRCLIPIKAVRELKSILAYEIRRDAKAEIKIRKGSQLEFEIGNKRLTAREITGNFPNWEMVIPKDFEFFAEINAKEFGEALTRVGVMADDTHRRIEFTFYPDKVSLKSESPETGHSVEELNCTFQKLMDSAENEPSGEGWKIAFNTKYIADFLSVHSGAARRDHLRIIWKFGRGKSQTEMMFEGEEKLFSYILVPLK